MIATFLSPFGRQQTGRITCGPSPISGVLVFLTAAGAHRLPVPLTVARRRSSFAIGASFSQARGYPHSLGRHPGGERRQQGRPCLLPASFLSGAPR